VLLMRLRSDLVEPLEAALAGRLVGLTTPDWDPCSAGPRGGTGCPGLSGHVAQGRRDHGPAVSPMRTPGSSMPGRPPTAARWSRGVAGSPVCALGGTVGDAQRRAYERLSRVPSRGCIIAATSAIARSHESASAPSARTVHACHTGAPARGSQVVREATFWHY
jgi:hypothetical protein